MNVRQLLLPPVVVIVIACQGAASAPPAAQPTTPPSTTPTGTPTPTQGGLGGVAAALTAAGVSAKAGSAFATEPIGGEGFALCVGPETVQTYAFIDHEAALAAQEKIDRDDPSTIGTTHVDWAGKPRFWLRENLILLYLGEDAATDAALRTLLGPPFAEGEPGRMALPGPPCS